MVAVVRLELVITPTEAPIDTLPDLAVPTVVAVCWPLLVALTLTSPVALMSAPAAIDASVDWFSVVTATAASKASLPPVAPAVAEASESPWLVAVSVMLLAWVMPAFAPTCACDVEVIRFKATDAPMPTLPPVAPPSVVGAAVAVLFESSSAVSVTAPPASAPAPLLISALPEVSDRFSASEAAIPTLLAPAPDFASAAMVLVVSPPTSVIVDSIVTPCAVTCALLPIEASLCESTLFTDTAAPMPTFAVLPTVLPSELALLSVLPLALTVSEPAVLTVTPSARLAVAFALTMLTATAAATETLPSSELAEVLLPSALPVAVC